jgi:5-methylcytosine-specific restriction endonuclease McrA
MQTKWTTLPDPNGPALVAPGWASAETKRLADDAAKMFDTTRRARAEAERLHEAAKQIDPMVTSVSDLAGAAGTARQSQLEALRDELLARSRFAEYLASLESDRRQTEAESLKRIDQARQQAKAALLSAGCPDLSEAVNHRGKPDEDLRAAFDQVVNACPEVGKAADTYSAARSMTAVLMERSSHNARNRSEAESSLRKMLGALAAAAVA